MSKRKSATKTETFAENGEEKKPKLANFAATRRQSTRRSTVKAQELIKKQTANDSGQESASEDEFVLPKKNKVSDDGVVVQPVNSFLSSESSGDEGVASTSKKYKKPNKKTAALTKKSALNVLSSDSEDEFESLAPAQHKSETKILAEVSRLTDSESELEDVPGQDLHELFPLLAKQDEAKSEEKKKAEDKKKKKKDKVVSSTLDVSQLLAMGETQEPVASTSKAEPKSKGRSSKPKKKQKTADTDESDWEEVEHGQEQIFPKEGVEVKIETDNGLRKKKTKTMDLESIIKRRINQIRREKQVELHKVSLLCCLSHGMIVNRQLNAPSLMAVALSILPSQHCYPPKKCDLGYLEKIVSWFKKKISVSEAKLDEDLTLIEQLEKSFQEMKVPNKKLLVLMFVAMMRSLGLKTRLIISLQPLPLKPNSQDLLAVTAKPEEAKKEAPKKGGKAAKVLEKKDEKPSKKETASKGKKSAPEVKKPANSKPEKAPAKSNRRKKEKESKYFSGKSESSPDIEQKLKSLRTRKTEKYVEISSDDSDLEEVQKLPKRKSSVKKEAKEEDDFQPEVVKVKRNSKIKVEDRRVISTDSERSSSPKVMKKVKAGNDYWAEVFAEMEEKWISVDLISGKVHCVEHLHSKATTPVLYVMGFNLDHTVRDLTRRYCPQYHTNTRKQRVEQDWWEEAINPFYGKKTAYDKEEEEEMNKQLQDRPVPKTLSELKNHPLYALKRHLLKFEGIYPPDAPPLGWFKDEPIYARECVFVLRSREIWLKEAKIVKLKQDPYKVVKSRPKYDRMSGQMLDGQPLELFGPWQTEDYVPPTAENGKVPRNEYGNVELYKPCMLPKGTAHIQISTLNKIAKKLNIDCAPAMVGFDFHCGGSHPVFDGFVVCEEFKDVLIDAHRQDEEEREKRGEEKRLKRIYGNWRKLVKALMIREKIMKKYDFGPGAEGEKKKTSKKAGPSTSKGSKLKQPVKRRKQESDESSESSDSS